MTKQTLTVHGMHCNSCSMLIKEALEDAGAKNVVVSLDEKKQIGTVMLDSSLSKEELKKIVETEGAYTVK